MSRIAAVARSEERTDFMLKVLIAEDELMIADLLEHVLVASGYEVCGIARTVDEAVALGELHKPDLAVLDVRLASGIAAGNRPATKQQRKFGSSTRRATTLETARSLADGEASIAKPYRPDWISCGRWQSSGRL